MQVRFHWQLACMVIIFGIEYFFKKIKKVLAFFLENCYNNIITSECGVAW